MDNIRLNKALALFGICSRREADKLIESGAIKLNSTMVKDLGTKISKNDIVSFSGKSYSLSSFAIKKRIWLYYKPSGLITTHKDEKNRKTIFDELKTKIKERVISVGRLDLNSEGLILITNDSDFANYAQSPEIGWERRYKVRIFGNIDNKIISELSSGVNIDGVQYKPMKVSIIRKSEGKNCWVDCTLTEGKNKEIRKLFAHYGISVNKLIRYKYGPYKLGGLEPSQIAETKFLKTKRHDELHIAL